MKPIFLGGKKRAPYMRAALRIRDLELSNTTLQLEHGSAGGHVPDEGGDGSGPAAQDLHRGRLRPQVHARHLARAAPLGGGAQRETSTKLPEKNCYLLAFERLHFIG